MDCWLPQCGYGVAPGGSGLEMCVLCRPLRLQALLLLPPAHPRALAGLWAFAHPPALQTLHPACTSHPGPFPQVPLPALPLPLRPLVTLLSQRSPHVPVPALWWPLCVYSGGHLALSVARAQIPPPRHSPQGPGGQQLVGSGPRHGCGRGKGKTGAPTCLLASVVPCRRVTEDRSVTPNE